MSKITSMPAYHAWDTLDLALHLTANFRIIQSYLPITIVYDVDDLLWPLSGTIAQRHGIEYDRCVANYRIHKNPLLTAAEKQSIIADFSDPDVFRDMQFFPGVQDILKPHELGAKVSINSNCHNSEIVNLKREQLLAAVPGLTDDDLHFNIIEYAGAKTFVSPMTIFADDSPYNAGASPALVNIMPTNIAWSCNKLAQKMTAEKIVLWRPDLPAINQAIYDLTKLLLILSQPFDQKA